MIINEDAYLEHIGTPRHSGRYPWGSGENPQQRNRNLLEHIDAMKAKGLSDKEIYEGLGMTSTEYIDRRSIARNEKKQADIAMAVDLKYNKGFSNIAIGKQMGDINESSVRALLAAAEKDSINILKTTSDFLRQQIDADLKAGGQGFIDVGSGVENHLAISKEKLRAAVRLLQDQGYALHTVQSDTLGTSADKKTSVKVLAPAGTKYKDIVTQKEKIHSIVGHSTDGGRSYTGIVPPLQFSSKRLDVKFAEDGGKEADGVIYVRPGVPDVSLGGNRYAQVRIAVDGTHYIKGMAMYKDDLPPGKDLQFNTNKSKSVYPTKVSALKPIKDDPDNPFGSAIRRQIGELDHEGNITKLTSVMNLVNEAGTWETWKKALSSQVLSKQHPALAKQQLDMIQERRKNEFDEIMHLTNPAVRKKLLMNFADGVDASSVSLEAAHLPRQQSHVILPINSMKPTEVYARGYRNGERVALIRYPHAGTFEIPELIVNNNHPEAKSLLGTAVDAIGINHKVAEHLSGADFDGDTVLVIPNPIDNPHLKTQNALHDLKHFDHQKQYPYYEGMKVMDKRTKGREMGSVSNLITDMTIKGAPNADLARAVKHSMVVIDAENHKLNWKQSAKDHNIAGLRAKYQDRAGGTASTLISRASGRIDVLDRKPGPIDPKTGEKTWRYTGKTYVDKKTGKTVDKMKVSEKLAEAKDAHTLVSRPNGTPMERIYADHSNRLKAFANQARKEAINTGPIVADSSAKKAYAPEVQSLNAKLNTALKNAPLERNAQIIAGHRLAMKKAANPNMDHDEIKKVSGALLMESRKRVGAGKEKIDITPEEWAAIQAGAITNHKLEQILTHADINKVKELATPRTRLLMTSAKTSRAKAMLANGYSEGDVAAALGVSLTTLKNTLNG